MYSVFYRRWQAEHRRLLPLRAEEYYERPKAVLARAMRFIGVAPPTGVPYLSPLFSLYLPCFLFITHVPYLPPLTFIGVAPPTDEAGWAPILSPMVQLAGSRPKVRVRVSYPYP